MGHALRQPRRLRYLLFFPGREATTPRISLLSGIGRRGFPQQIFFSGHNFSVIFQDYLIKNEAAENTLNALDNQNLTNQNHERLQVEAAQRDTACFAELYENNFDRVYAYIARRVGNREEAQDLTADVFHQALVNLPRFEWRGSPFIAWLLGIAANLLSDRWRKAASCREVVTDDLEQVGTEEDIYQRAMLYQLVDTLPDDQRRVIIRRFVSQKSLREIAADLGRSEGAIKQLQLRALQNLRERIRSSHG
jgi:RNA polymerase sigma-70 factor (ECF subfamily)